MIFFTIDNWSIWDLDENLKTKHTNIHQGKANPSDLSAMTKRRMPPLARAMYCLQRTVPDAYLPTIYASKHAELSRTIGLIRQFGSELSPLNFSMSVHNSIPGLLSVIEKNKQPYSVIDSLSGVIEMAVFEACSWLGSHDKVRLIYFEEKTQDFIRDSFEINDMAMVLSMDISVGKDWSLSSDRQTDNQQSVAKDITDVVGYARLLSGEIKQLLTHTQRLQWSWQKQ